MQIKPFFKHTLLIFGLFLSSTPAWAQFKFNKSGYIEFKVGGNIAENPFLGGLNSPQFQQMDLNEDGKLDLLVFDRTDNKLLTFIKISGDYFKYTPEYEHLFPQIKYVFKLADLNSDGKQDVFTCQETGELIIYLNQTTQPGKLKFKNLGPQVYRNQHDTTFWILYNSLSFGNMKTDLPEIKDLDNDGDLDIIVYDAMYLTYTMFKDVRAEKGWSKDTFEFQNMDYCYGYFWEGFDNNIRLNMCFLQGSGSNFKPKLRPRHLGGASCWFVDEDRDGDYEMYLGNIGAKKITRLVNGKIDSKHEYDTMIHVDTMYPDKNQSFNGFVFPAGYPTLLNDDTLTDLILAPNSLSDSKETDQVWYYKNIGTPTKPEYSLVKKTYIADKSIDFGAKSAPAFIDIDLDGDQDLLVASNGDFDKTQGQKDVVALFTNVGSKNIPKYELTTSDFLKTDSLWQQLIPSTGDIDNDGDVDLLLGNSKGRVIWYENTATKGSKPNLVYNTDNLLKYQNMPSETSFSPEVYDYNKDGINDLIVGMYNGRVALFEGQNAGGTPSFTWKTSKAWGARANLWREDVSPTGFESYGYATPRIADLNNDGIKELVVGTFFGGVRLYHIHEHPYTDSLIADETMLYQDFNKDTFVPYMSYRTVPAIADLDGDSIPEMMFGLLRGGLEFAKSDYSKVKIGIDNKSLAQTQLKIFPNPAKNNFTIQIPANQNEWIISILDIQGAEFAKTRMNKWESAIQVKLNAPTGVYLIKLSNKFGDTITQKLLLSND